MSAGGRVVVVAFLAATGLGPEASLQASGVTARPARTVAQEILRIMACFSGRDRPEGVGRKENRPGSPRDFRGGAFRLQPLERFFVQELPDAVKERVAHRVLAAADFAADTHAGEVQVQRDLILRVDVVAADADVAIND